jgi:hypothetical protein
MDRTTREVQGIDGPVFVLDHWEGVSLANAVQKKLDKHLDEQFYQQVSMEVTKRVSDIMKDPEL